MSAERPAGRDLVEGARRRLLLVAPLFPPGTGAGALRWEKLSRFLVSSGWQVDVLTREVPPRERDEARLAALPPDVRSLAVPPQPTVGERLASWLTGLRRRSRTTRAGTAAARATPATAGEAASLRPDETRWALASRPGLRRAYTVWLLHQRDWGWARAAWRTALSLDPRRYAAVISCGPPHFAHLAALRVSRAAHIPLIVDYRDPWATRRRLPEAYASQLYYAIADRHEAELFRAAGLVTTTCDSLSDALRAAHPGLRVETIMNGYDEEDAPPLTAWGTQFVVAYAGGIYLDRDPRPLFRAARRVTETLRLGPSQFAVELIGTEDNYGGVSVVELARQEGVAPFVHMVPRQPQDKLRHTLSRAAVLVSLPQDSPFAIPSKLFEYMQYGSWLLALTNAGTPIAEVLQGTGADVHAPADIEAIARTLAQRYQEFAAGSRPEPIATRVRYSRREQAERLIAALEPLVAPRR